MEEVEGGGREAGEDEALNLAVLDGVLGLLRKVGGESIVAERTQSYADAVAETEGDLGDYVCPVAGCYVSCDCLGVLVFGVAERFFDTLESQYFALAYHFGLFDEGEGGDCHC